MDPLLRDRYLREMGLGPVWRSRTLASTAPAPSAAPEAPGADTGDTSARQMQDTVSPPASGQAREAQILGMAWPQLKEAVGGCNACTLCRSRKQTVFGVGDEQADWMLVGEAPGAEEDARGEPFVGQAGRLLDSMLGSIGLARANNVYICNVLKCRPPGNRNPEPVEVERCSPYLWRQIQLVQPKLIVAMGRFAAQTLLSTDATIGSLRGRVHHYRGLPLLVTYHPAYLLRTLPDKSKAWEDLCLARKTMATL